MKKAIIATGGKQYLVAEGQTLEVELLNQEDKTATFVPLLVIDDKKVSVGTPEVKGAVVTADIVDESVRAEKVTAIRYKPKKRVHKVRGHRQQHAVILIKKITS